MTARALAILAAALGLAGAGCGSSTKSRSQAPAGRASIAVAHADPSGAETVSLSGGAMPAGTVLGRNSFGTLGYRGPCPPTGSAPHRYHITVYALGRPSMLKRDSRPTRSPRCPRSQPAA